MRRFNMLYALLLIIGCQSHKLSSALPIIGEHKFSIMQGATTDNQAQFNLIAPKKVKLDKNSITILDKISNLPAKVTLINFSRIEKKHSAWVIYKFTIKNLTLDKNYILKVSTDNKKWSDHREFSALDTKNKNLKFFIASCMSDTYNEIGNIIWPSALKKEFDIMLLIGDNVYADIFNGIYLKTEVTPTHLWNRYMDSRLNLAIYRSKKLIPIYATWDDHDYGKNDGDKSYRYKTASKRIFKQFMAQANDSVFTNGFGVGSHLKIAGQNFYFLDDRSFRDSKKNKEGEHFGKGQEAWLFKSLKANAGTSWIISGDQFFGAYHPYESYEGLHPKAFNNFLGQIREIGRKVIFVSGDRHLSELMQISAELAGHSTYEITVSGLHTIVFPGSLARNPNSRRIGGVDGTYNFGIIELESALEEDTRFKFELYNLNGKPVYSKHLKI